MSTEDDLDPFTEELRGDLPTPLDEARLRLRLVSAGVLGSASVIVPGAATAASAGVVAKLGALPLFAKLGAGVAVAALATVPVVVHVTRAPTAPARATVTSRVVAAPPAVAPRDDAPLAPPPSPVLRAAPEAATPKAPEVAPRGAAHSLAAPAVETPVVTSPEPARPSVGSFDVIPAPTPVDEGTLRAETALMERSLAAMQRGDFTAARLGLAEHAQKFPNGHLAPERRRALERMLGKETKP